MSEDLPWESDETPPALNTAPPTTATSSNNVDTSGAPNTSAVTPQKEVSPTANNDSLNKLPSEAEDSFMVVREENTKEGGGEVGESMKELSLLSSSNSPAGGRPMLTSPMSPTSVKLDIPLNMRSLNKDNVKVNKKRPLGKGSFAQVYAGELIPSGEMVAVKVMDKSAVGKSTFVNLQQEVNICSTLSHACIINTRGIFEDEDQIYIVMDCAEGGELLKYMKKFGLEDMHINAPKFVAEVIIGLEYMMQEGVIHRDIKPENLLLTSEFHVKLADFGTVCRVDDDKTTFTGTALYVSPEAIITGKCSKTSDIWAVGCVLFELFVSTPPFKGDSQYQIMQSIKARNFMFPPYFPEDAKDLVNRMLELDPMKRIGSNGINEIKAHPFFAKVDWSTLLTVSNKTYLNENFDRKFEAFLLKNEHVVYSSAIVKERYKGLSVKERTLILTDFPRLFYLDPADNSIKGHVPWTTELCAMLDDKRMFHVVAPGRTYHFVDAENRADIWVAKINDVVTKSRNKPGLTSPTRK